MRFLLPALPPWCSPLFLAVWLAMMACPFGLMAAEPGVGPIPGTEAGPPAASDATTRTAEPAAPVATSTPAEPAAATAPAAPAAPAEPAAAAPAAAPAAAQPETCGCGAYHQLRMRYRQDPTGVRARLGLCRRGQGHGQGHGPCRRHGGPWCTP